MGLWQTIHDAGSQVFGYESYAEEERRKQGEKATQIAHQQQADLAQQNSGLDVLGYDPPGITQCVNWSGFSHAQIFQTNQESIDQGKVGESAQAWLDLAKGLRERGRNYSADIAKIVDGGWQGEAASNAREVGKPASDWMIASADAFEMTGNNLNAAGEAAGQSKKMVEQPQGFSWGEAAASTIPLGLAGGGMNALAQMEQQEQAEKAAQETMARVYSPTLTQVDAKMPQYKAPDGATKEPPPVTPPDRTDWGEVGPGEVGPSNVGPSNVGPSNVGPGNVGPGNVGPSGAGSGRDPGGIGFGNGPGGGVGGFGGGSGGGSGNYGGYTPPAATDSQWAGQPGGPGTGLPSTGIGGGAGIGTGAGAGGIGAGMVGGMAGGIGAGGASGASGMAAGGRAGAGGLGAGGGVGAGAAGAAGARGAAAGRGMMGGMGGAGQRGQGGEDEDHERPSWLEEQDDVWMNDMPRTAPPVLGE
ncbi:PPE domain-containing protein [Saccharopolyspora sp. 5N708]|uniref:PPE domain-containing protein n=1 Tax=Saccharopolyspora sp. 5N708 TaxID=3457424 RepID=UPI003FD46107